MLGQLCCVLCLERSEIFRHGFWGDLFGLIHLHPGQDLLPLRLLLNQCVKLTPQLPSLQFQLLYLCRW
jgi:hypothetical protein